MKSKSFIPSSHQPQQHDKASDYVGIFFIGAIFLSTVICFLIANHS